MLQELGSQRIASNTSSALPRARLDTATPAVGFLLLCIGVWWAAGFYRAFEHDAVFYAGEALWRAGLAQLGSDPFFRYGSQGAFSIFTDPYAWLLRHGEPQAVAFGLTALARWAWLAALYALLRQLAPSGPVAAIATGAALLMPAYYEPFRVFAYAEAFATPRVVAEAVGLASLALLAAGRRGWAVALALLALAIHPLMALPVLGVALMGVTRLWATRTGPVGLRVGVATIVASVLLIVVLAGLGVPPLDRLFQRYDPAWWAIVVERNFVTVVQAWTEQGLAHLAAWLVLLTTVAAALSPGSSPRRLASWTLLAAAFCVLAWMFGSWTHNVLLVQLQLWRAMWLVQLLTPAWWIVAAAQETEWPAQKRALYLFATAAMLATTWNGLVLALLALLLQRFGPAVTRHVSPPLQLKLAAALFGIVVLSRLAALSDWRVVASTLTDAGLPWLRALAWEPVVWLAAGAAIAAGWRWRQPPRAAAVAALLLGVAAAVGGFGLWWAEAVPRMATGPAETIAKLQGVIPPGATVHWQQPLERTWLDLKRASYATNAQGASALFSRDGALELQRRLERLRQVGLADGPAAWALHPGKSRINAERALFLCQDPALDYAIIPGNVAAADHQLPGQGTESFSIFDCPRHRTAAPETSTP